MPMSERHDASQRQTTANGLLHAPRRAPIADRLDDVARTHGWAWPVGLAAVGVIVATVMAAVHRQLDLNTYLMGGDHAFSTDLYRVIYAPTQHGFTYPPFASLLFVPLTHLRSRVDQILFTWLSLAALFALLAVCLRVTCPRLERRAVAWWALVLLTPAGLLDPARETLVLGQINLLLAAGVTADMTLIRPQRKGIFVGLAAAIKMTPILLIPYLVVTRQTRAGRRALGTFVAAAALAAAASPGASWIYWTRDAWRPGRAGWLPWIGNQGAAGAVERVMHHALSTVPMLALCGGIVGVGLYLAVQLYQPSLPMLGFLVMEVTESLASPVSWAHHMIWVIPLLAWLVLAVDRPRHGAWWAAAVSVVFFAGPIWWVPHGPAVKYAGHGWSILLANSFFIVVVAILVAASVRLVASRRAVGQSQCVSSRRHEGWVV
jgi:alpha-1,2-mannosyltransferase